MNLQLNIPATWNELSIAQQMKAYSLIMGESRMLLDPHEVVTARRILLFKELSGITEEQFKAWEEDCIQEDAEHGETAFLEELDNALQACDGLFDISSTTDAETGETVTTYAVKLGLTATPWPVLVRTKKSGKKIEYVAPSDGLENITFLELCVTFSLFEQFIQDYDEDILSELLAVLYRLPKPSNKKNKRARYHGDRRQPYLHHEHMVPGRKKKMAQLPMPVRQMLLFWFASCRQQIITSFPDLFTAPSGTKQPNKYGWGSMLMAMANNLSELDTVSATLAEDALTYLDHLNEQAKRREQEIKQKTTA